MKWEKPELEWAFVSKPGPDGTFTVLTTPIFDIIMCKYAFRKLQLPIPEVKKEVKKDDRVPSKDC